MADRLIFILVGPSGSGKTTIIQRALHDVHDLRKHVTYTTRPPRSDEVNDVDYHFVDRATFERWRAENKFVEWEEFYHTLYGSTYDSIIQAIGGDVDRITSVEVLGAENLQRLYPDNVITIFIVPPSADIARERREQREASSGKEQEPVADATTLQQKSDRAERTPMELSHAGSFKYALLNEDLDEAVRNVEAIIRAERCARFVREIRQKGLDTLT